MFLRAQMGRISTLFSIPSYPLIPLFLSSSISSSHIPYTIRCHGSLSTAHEPSSSSSSSAPRNSPEAAVNRWKPMCLYYTQGKCTMMDDPLHLLKFNHDISRELQVNVARSNHMPSQDIDFFLVLDLEGKVEIIEFPVLLINAKTMAVTDFFHRFVRPSRMSEQRINEYIEGKYGKFGVDRVWHDTAIPFKEVIQEFEDWLIRHQLWRKELGGCLDRAAFVTCGNWDIKTQVPHQCSVSNMKLPEYFMEWINIKDVYLNFYQKKATGMVTMMKQLKIPLMGSHHLGIDDTRNIVRVLQRMLADGSLLQITARRQPNSPHQITKQIPNPINQTGPKFPQLNRNWALLLQKLENNARNHSKSSNIPKTQTSISVLGKRKERSDVDSNDSQKNNSLVPVNDDFSLTDEVAMDCEMVGVSQGNRSALGRVTLVNKWRNVIYDEFVRPLERVVDFRTQISGIRPCDLKKAKDFPTAQKKVAELIKGKILVGHALRYDLKALRLSHPKKDLRDTSDYQLYKKEGCNRALRHLAAEFLGVDIQNGEHCPIEDARAAMMLYQTKKKEWEKSVKAEMKLKLEQKKRKPRKKL